ncbi:hypothetical protein [Laspinema olomoucense]|uniref:hypothetical protein n=1 Tax=Laspinema olomoucense TaxID=3231600 RepID=UPI0021BA55C5|nr:hypothetical protein [Laspinema sp. D3d]MCT7972963.1 hypothetical protein [Laspinema sp. D3d]
MANNSDKDIAKALGGRQEATIRKHIEAICDKMGIEAPPQTSRRPQLFGLVAQYKPELLGNSTPTVVNPSEETTGDFVGREKAIADLDALVARGDSRCILIQGPGGVGKTVLAERYLAQRFKPPILRFDIAKETQAINSAEGWIEQNLQKLGEEPGHEFGVSCDRLRSKLQSEVIGILVDNLEPALDKNGKLISEHRSYVELLRVLCDTSLKSLTLITSRERICESLNIPHYRLEYLNVDAWREYFSQEELSVNSPILPKIHQAYGGNALAMRVLRERIAFDYERDIEYYWKSHAIEEDISVEKAVQNLLFEQFNRLESIDVAAYDLLCRMGCFRYQDVPTVPNEGLLALLWDIPKKEAANAIDALWTRGLIERLNREYKLHPLIRQEAIERLRNSADWEQANRTAAEFWTESIKTIESTKEAVKAHEAYYHNLAIKNLQKCCEVLVKTRRTKGETLWRAYYRLGLADRMTDSLLDICNKFEIEDSVYGPEVYNALSDMFWIKGNLNSAIQYCKKTKNLATKFGNTDMLATSVLILGLCKISLHAFQESLEVFHEYMRISREKKLSNHEPTSYFCLAYVNSQLNNTNQAKYFLDIFLEEVEYAPTPWDVGYAPLFCATTFKNLGLTQKACELYNQAIEFSTNQYYYPQVKAKALTGLAELDRIHNNFESALSKHTESIQILKKICAECDLAEAYYQLGLTHQAMGEISNSKSYFNQAIQLWKKIDAPKQIERVHRSMGG